MELKDILGILNRHPHLTFADFQELQGRYDQEYVDPKFSTSLEKVEHTYAHLGKLIGRIAD